jgi:decaprenylphospho-beta-D-ribofuranose 2-oxidase
LQYRNGALRSGMQNLVPLAQFHFFHDYVPNWKRSFQPGGILQYQVFVPREQAPSVFHQLLRRSAEGGHIPYLAVMKLHREDRFTVLSYNVDGYSLSLDYHETAANRRHLRAMLSAFTEDIVIPGNGRFYLAKDSILTAEQARRSFTAGAVDAFVRVKQRVDPEDVIVSDLARRLFNL